MCCKEEYLTVIGIKNEEDLEEVVNVCSDIAKIDKSFRYGLYPSKFSKYKKVLIIFSKTRDDAFKRGVWFSSKVKLPSGEKLLFWVKKRVKK